METSFFNALREHYVGTLSDSDKAELAKFASDLTHAMSSKQLEKVAAVVSEGVSELDSAEDVGRASRILHFLDEMHSISEQTGFEKKASSEFFDKVIKAAPAIRAGIGLVGAGAALGSIGHRIYQHRSERKGADRNLRASYKQIRTERPELFQGKNAPDSSRYFGLLTSFAPDVASNPLVAGNILNRIHLNGPGSVDAMQVKDLAEAQSAIANSRERSTLGLGLRQDAQAFGKSLLSMSKGKDEPSKKGGATY